MLLRSVGGSVYVGIAEADSVQAVWRQDKCPWQEKRFYKECGGSSLWTWTASTTASVEAKVSVKHGNRKSRWEMQRGLLLRNMWK
jgi:hypothetical protein